MAASAKLRAVIWLTSLSQTAFEVSGSRIGLAKKPMMKQPRMFTKMVPQGKVSPSQRVTTTEHQ